MTGPPPNDAGENVNIFLLNLEIIYVPVILMKKTDSLEISWEEMQLELEIRPQELSEALLCLTSFIHKITPA